MMYSVPKWGQCSMFLVDFYSFREQMTEKNNNNTFFVQIVSFEKRKAQKRDQVHIFPKGAARVSMWDKLDLDRWWQ